MRGLLVLPCVLVAACDPGFGIQGTVVDSSGAPVAGASVVMSCPHAYKPESQVTKADGRFQFGGVGGASTADACTLTFSKAGLATKTMGATALCFRSTKTRNLGTPCGPAEGRVTLTP